MAVGNRHRDAAKAERRSFGTFSLHGGGGKVHLTVTNNLDDYEFPNDLGQEVRVELVDEPDREPYLEIHPAGGGDGE